MDEPPNYPLYLPAGVGRGSLGLFASDRSITWTCRLRLARCVALAVDWHLFAAEAGNPGAVDGASRTNACQEAPMRMFVRCLVMCGVVTATGTLWSQETSAQGKSILDWTGTRSSTPRK